MLILGVLSGLTACYVAVSEVVQLLFVVASMQEIAKRVEPLVAPIASHVLMPAAGDACYPPGCDEDEVYAYAAALRP